MLQKVRHGITGTILMLFLIIHTVLWVPALLVLSILKYGIPLKKSRACCNRLLEGVEYGWIGINNRAFNLFHNMQWIVEGADNLAYKSSYLVLPNHQSAADIFVLEYILHRKIPAPKFFLKWELIWVPIMGWIWKILDFPFMKRYPREKIMKKPHLKGKDLEITRKSCEKFRNIPVAIINFVEGTRFTREKHARQQSPYKHLLKPKAGGIAFVLGAMGEQFHRLLDVTIVYPEGVHGFWGFLCGKVRKVVVHINDLPIASELIGDYFNDPSFKKQFQGWLNTRWHTKDAQIDEILEAHSAS